MNQISYPSRAHERTQNLAGYPLQRSFIVAGLFAAIICGALEGALVGLAVLALFVLVGASWRSDMLPVMPFCLAFQWVSASVGYIYFKVYGRFPGGGDSMALGESLLVSLAGLGALVIGWRLALSLFQKQVFARTLSQPSVYQLSRLFSVTIFCFSLGYVFDIVPRQLWFGGAQIIESLLALQFVPFFILLTVAFQRREGRHYAALATVFVIGPGLLTGFSRFKEVLFVVLMAALAQWRPWINTPRQKRQNQRILLFGILGVLLLTALGLLWSGGVKQEWRAEIWQGDLEGSPIERMRSFYAVVRRVASDLDVNQASEQLASRLSSGALYFAYVLERVPDLIPHENGRLFGLAIANATKPRFLFPDKTDLGGDTWIVRQYAGIAAAGDESDTSIGLGYLAEFYIDFGVLGVILLACFWGFTGGSVMSLAAKVAPTREIFLALATSLFTQYFMAFEGSFIKLFAGLLQRTIIASLVLAALGPLIRRWLAAAPRQRRSQWEAGLRQASSQKWHALSFGDPFKKNDGL